MFIENIDMTIIINSYGSKIFNVDLNSIMMTSKLFLTIIHKIVNKQFSKHLAEITIVEVSPMNFPIEENIINQLSEITICIP